MLPVRLDRHLAKVRTPGGQKEYEIQSIDFVEEELPADLDVDVGSGA